MIVANDGSAVPSVEGVEFRRTSQADGYAVGSDGTVWTCRPKRPYYAAVTWRKLAPGMSKWGYQLVSLTVGDCVTKTFSVHRLVASAFAGECPYGLEVRHLDGNSMNNSASNLRYGTKSENTYDAIRHGTHPCTRVGGAGNPRAKLTTEEVLEIREMKAAGMSPANIRKTGRFAVSPSTIQRIVSGKLWADAACLSTRVRKAGETECSGKN
jgi:hypothetical protein